MPGEKPHKNSLFSAEQVSDISEAPVQRNLTNGRLVSSLLVHCMCKIQYLFNVFAITHFLSIFKRRQMNTQIGEWPDKEQNAM